MDKKLAKDELDELVYRSKFCRDPAIFQHGSGIGVNIARCCIPRLPCSCSAGSFPVLCYPVIVLDRGLVIEAAVHIEFHGIDPRIASGVGQMSPNDYTIKG